MLDALKFVQGAVAKKDFIPAMTHFSIEKGVVRAYNGVIGLSSPLPFNIDCNPKAVPLVQAISQCSDTIELSMTPAKRLCIRSGDFKQFIECIEEETPHVTPDGKHIDLSPTITEVDKDGKEVQITLGGLMLRAFKTLETFIGDDASRPWGTGVLLRGECAYATNNVILVECWMRAQFPVMVNVPKVAIREILRINKPPTHAQVTDNSMTFHYEDSRWIRTQLLNNEWPDVDKLLGKENAATPIDPRIFVALGKVKQAADKMGRVFIKDGVFSTTVEPTEGAHYKVPDLKAEGIYQINMLMLLEGVATHMDFTGYPTPCIFYGDDIRGAIIGMRL